jgi:hypothetical protein
VICSAGAPLPNAVHCERSRSKSIRAARGEMDCFVASAPRNDGIGPPHPQLSSPAKAGDPVRNRLLVRSLRLWNTGPRMRGDDSEGADAPSHSRGAIARSFADRFALLTSEGAGNAGCALHPRSHVRRALKNMHMSIQGSGEHPTSPAQWLYGLWRALPGEQLFCLRSALGNRTSPGALTPALRRRDHTLLPYAITASSGATSRPPHPRPRLTIANAPLSGTGYPQRAGDLGYGSRAFRLSGNNFRKSKHSPPSRLALTDSKYRKQPMHSRDWVAVVPPYQIQAILPREGRRIAPRGSTPTAEAQIRLPSANGFSSRSP